MRSFRRYQIDCFLNSSEKMLFGRVLDIGGKKKGKRGTFKPPIRDGLSFTYLNNSPITKPDILADAHDIPCEDESFECVLICELLEHVRHPEVVLGEAFRSLKSGGVIVGTVPFLFKVHADPFDYQRWTSLKVEAALQEVGFSQIRISPMGGVVGVIFDLLRGVLVDGREVQSFPKKVGQRALNLFFPVFVYFDRFSFRSRAHTTSGWNFTAKKL